MDEVRGKGPGRSFSSLFLWSARCPVQWCPPCHFHLSPLSCGCNTAFWVWMKAWNNLMTLTRVRWWTGWVLCQLDIGYSDLGRGTRLRAMQMMEACLVEFQRETKILFGPFMWYFRLIICRNQWPSSVRKTSVANCDDLNSIRGAYMVDENRLLQILSTSISTLKNGKNILKYFIKKNLWKWTLYFAETNKIWEVFS